MLADNIEMDGAFELIIRSFLYQVYTFFSSTARILFYPRRNKRHKSKPHFTQFVFQPTIVISKF